MGSFCSFCPSWAFADGHCMVEEIDQMETTECIETVPVQAAIPFLQWTPIIAGAFVAAAVSVISSLFARQSASRPSQHFQRGGTHHQHWEWLPVFICC
jgi:hypothetical protein